MEKPLTKARTTFSATLEDVIDLQRERERNDLTLKSAFEDIIKKYSKDFTEVGDEVDLETGEIIVDNGHLSRMRDERDTGTTNVGRFLNSMRSLAEGTDEEEDDSTVYDGESDPTTNDEELDHDSEVDDSIVNRIENQDSTPIPITRHYDEYDEDGEDILASSPARPVRKKPRTQTISMANSNLSSKSSSYSRQTLNTRHQHQKQDRSELRQNDSSITPTDLEAFGQSIATQIARFMGQYKTSGQATADDLWSFPILPQDPKSARARTTMETMPKSGYQPSPGKRSIWALPEDATPPPRLRKVPSAKAQTSLTGVHLESHDIALEGDALVRSVNPIDNLSSKSSCLPGRISHSRPKNSQLDQKLPQQKAFKTSDITHGSRDIHASTSARSGYENSNVADVTNHGHIETISLLDDTSQSEDEAFPTSVHLGRFNPSHQSGDTDYAANTSRSLSGLGTVHDVDKVRLTAEDDALLGDLVEKRYMIWDQVMHYFPGRDLEVLRYRFEKHVQRRRKSLIVGNSKHPRVTKTHFITKPGPSQNDANFCATDAKLVSTIPSDDSKTDKPQRTFTKKEDKLLIDLHDRAKMSFKELAHHFRGRSIVTLRDRYKKLQRSNKSAGQETKTPRLSGFTPDEDDLIMEIFKDDEPPSYQELESYFPGRASATIVDRYQALLEVKWKSIKSSTDLDRPHHRESEPMKKITSEPRKEGSSGQVADRSTQVKPKAPPDVLTDIDVALLVDLKENKKLSWADVEKHFPNKKKTQLLYIYYRRLNRGRYGEQRSSDVDIVSGHEKQCKDVEASPQTIVQSTSTVQPVQPESNLPIPIALLSVERLPAESLPARDLSAQPLPVQSTFSESADIEPLSANLNLQDETNSVKRVLETDHRDDDNMDEVDEVEPDGTKGTEQVKRGSQAQTLPDSIDQEYASESLGNKPPPPRARRRPRTKRRRSKFLGENLNAKLLLELKEERQLSWKEVLEHFPEENHNRLRSFYYVRLAPQIRLMGGYDPDNFPQSLLQPQLVSDDDDDLDFVPEVNNVSAGEGYESMAKESDEPALLVRRNTKSSHKRPRNPEVIPNEKLSLNVESNDHFRPHGAGKPPKRQKTPQIRRTSEERTSICTNESAQVLALQKQALPKTKLRITCKSSRERAKNTSKNLDQSVLPAANLDKSLTIGPHPPNELPAAESDKQSFDGDIADEALQTRVSASESRLAGPTDLTQAGCEPRLHDKQSRVVQIVPDTLSPLPTFGPIPVRDLMHEQTTTAGQPVYQVPLRTLSREIFVTSVATTSSRRSKPSAERFGQKGIDCTGLMEVEDDEDLSFLDPALRPPKEAAQVDSSILPNHAASSKTRVAVPSQRGPPTPQTTTTLSTNNIIGGPAVPISRMRRPPPEAFQPLLLPEEILEWNTPTFAKRLFDRVPLNIAAITGLRRSRTVRLSRYDQPSLLVVFRYQPKASPPRISQSMALQSTLPHLTRIPAEPIGKRDEQYASQNAYSPFLTSEYEDETDETDESDIEIDFKSLGAAARRRFNYPRTLQLPRSGQVIQSLFPPDPPSSPEPDSNDFALSLAQHGKENIAEVNGGPGTDAKFRTIMPRPINAKRTNEGPRPKLLSTANSNTSCISKDANAETVISAPLAKKNAAVESPISNAPQARQQFSKRKAGSGRQRHKTSKDDSGGTRTANTWLFVGDTDSEDDVFAR